MTHNAIPRRRRGSNQRALDSFHRNVPAQRECPATMPSASPGRLLLPRVECSRRSPARWIGTRKDRPALACSRCDEQVTVDTGCGFSRSKVEKAACRLHSGAMLDRITPINKTLIIINFAVFLLQELLGGWVGWPFALWPPATDLFRPSQLVTYGFLLGYWAHLFFNMFALYRFGSEIERLFGSRRYLTYYFSCVVGAALMHLIVMSQSGLPPAPTVG